MLFVCSLLIAQTDTIIAKKEVINYRKGMHNLKYGKNLMLKIENVNPFISKTYSITKPINYDFSSAEFQKISLANEAKKVDNETEQIVKGDKIKTKNKNIIEDFNAVTVSYANTLAFKKSLNFLNAFDAENTETSKIVDSLNIVLIQQMKEMESFKKEIKSLKDLTKDQKEQIIKLTEVETAKKEFLDDFKNFQIAFEQINNYSLLNSLLVDQIKESSTFINDTTAFKDKAKTTLNSLGLAGAVEIKKDVVKQIENISSLYANLNSNYQKINQVLNKRNFDFKGELNDGKNTLTISNMNASFDLKYYFEDEMKKVKAINDSITLPKNKQKIIKETFKGCDLYNEITNQDYILYISSAFIYEDKADIIFQLKNDKNEILYSYPTIKVKTYNQLKINGSAGYFLNFIGDESFETFKKENDPKNYLRASSQNTIKHALGGLLHAYYNITPGLASGLSAGLSINDDANASFYTGVSFFITESNRLVITSGVSFVKIATLKTANLFTDDKNNFFYTDENYQIQYEKVYKPSFFIGISYNLF
jgi:hypothetical protein